MKAPIRNTATALAALLLAGGLSGCYSLDGTPLFADTDTSDAAPAAQSTPTAAPKIPLPPASTSTPKIPRDAVLDDYSYIAALCDNAPAGHDLGEQWSSGAQGTVEDRNADGLATLYTVGQGDSYRAVVERFCLDAREFDRLNGITDGQLYYGDVVALREEGANRAQRADRIPGDSGPVYYTHQDCTGPIARVNLYRLEGDPEGETRVEMSGTPRDTRPGKYASGTVEVVDGQPIRYTVDAGDTWRGIGDRFCTDSVMLSMYNERAGLVGDPLHPGDVVEITPQRKTVPDPFA